MAGTCVLKNSKGICLKLKKKNYTVCKYPCAARLNAATWISFQFKALCFMSSATLSLSLFNSVKFDFIYKGQITTTVAVQQSSDPL